MLKPMPTIFDYRPPTEPWLTVLHADDDIVVLDKPSGLLTVPGNSPDLQDSLETRVQARWPTGKVVHRLDKDTSGILLMALNKKALGFLGSQFEHRKITKAYTARVWGVMDGDSGTVDLPLATVWDNKPRQMVDYEHGRAAQTDWEVIEREPSATRVRLVPKTGRTHQLRVHMMMLGHPILGDEFYATGEALAATGRLQLHNQELGFTHPKGTSMTFVSPAPF
jgi:tRNA pseudouridine32 synthase/23S rRNA pseudouridine746 synthase